MSDLDKESQEHIDDEHNKTNPKNNKNSKTKILLTLGLIIIMLSIIIVIANTPITFTVPYQTTETYQEPYIVEESYQASVPYQETEYYTEKVPESVIYYELESFIDTRKVPTKLLYNVEFIDCRGRILAVPPTLFNSGSDGSPAIVKIKVTNHDSVGGTFTFKPYLILPDDNKIGYETSTYIYPQQSSYFVYTADVDIKTCTYDTISIPKKDVTEIFTNYHDVQKSRIEFNNVQKSRIITKYRSEIKHHNVTKQKTSKRTIITYREETIKVYQYIFNKIYKIVHNEVI